MQKGLEANAGGHTPAASSPGADMPDLYSLAQQYFSQHFIQKFSPALIGAPILFLLLCAADVWKRGWSRKLIRSFLWNLDVVVRLLLLFGAIDFAQWFSVTYPDNYANAVNFAKAVKLPEIIAALVFVYLVYYFWPQIKKALAAKPPEPAPVQTQPAARLPALTTTTTPVRAMQLKLRRSQRAGGMLGNKVIFALDARVDLSADEQQLVRKFALGKLVVYDSEARKRRGEAAYGHFDNAAHTAGYDLKSAGRGLWRNARGLASAAMMALSLRVTVDSLIGGQHIECKDLDELLGAESAIVDACKNLKGYLDTALTFDGREEVLEF